MSYGTLAVPQVGGSDTDTLVCMTWAKWSPESFALFESNHHLLGRPIERRNTAVGEGLESALEGDSRIFDAEVALRRWPRSVEIARLLTSFVPLVGRLQGRGCISGNDHPSRNGGRVSIHVTIDDAVGCAEGVVHEIAHQRLHVLGIDLEEHDGILIDAPETPPHEYFSPIRRDVPRPVTALLHGIYAWTFMLEIDLAACGIDAGEEFLQRNVPKVRMGLRTLESVPWTNAGQDFFNAFYGWAQSAIVRGENALQAASMEEVPVPEKEW